ncbi:hypothetical protein GYMLUDRAFT_244180 [Collybiopsis luxurians FD-317 M1]|uniref:Uncharacterized protein n=1 Tax=Collybiopsis luxurians FD-317 M1 TaxID=944289 RepID=A0A0D0CWU1_9AGAR|nr:hypothetical protein GYMLUDRAFT_244180 [Collybiopsis luxurians FD-317 M1]
MNKSLVKAPTGLPLGMGADNTADDAVVLSDDSDTDDDSLRSLGVVAEEDISPSPALGAGSTSVSAIDTQVGLPTPVLTTTAVADTLTATSAVTDTTIATSATVATPTVTSAVADTTVGSLAINDTSAAAFTAVANILAAAVAPSPVIILATPAMGSNRWYAVT